MCQCMPVKMVSLICRPLCHMPSVVWETSCDIGMKYPPFLQDKPPHLHPLPSPLFLYYTFVIGGATMQSIQLATTDFTITFPFYFGRGQHNVENI